MMNIDNLWMVISSLTSNKIKWKNWNSKFHVDRNSVQKIAYLPQINESPTKDAVVFKTMEITKENGKECNQMYISTTYDLAIAIKAFRIQRNCAPLFDSLFIHVGEFHLKISFYEALGKLIEDCGIPEIWVTCGLIADGSLGKLIRS